MATNDPIADMLTRIRNAVATRKPRVRIKRTKVCLGIARVLKEEGYIRDFISIDDACGQGEIEVDLKYGEQGEMVFREMRRASRPGRRLHRPVAELPRLHQAGVHQQVQGPVDRRLADPGPAALDLLHDLLDARVPLQAEEDLGDPEAGHRDPPSPGSDVIDQAILPGRGVPSRSATHGASCRCSRTSVVQVISNHRGCPPRETRAEAASTTSPRSGLPVRGSTCHRPLPRP